MTAKEMFAKEGFHQYANNDSFICYTAGEKSDWKRIKYKLKTKKLTIHSDVSMSLLKAIVKQLQELKWVEESEICSL